MAKFRIFKTEEFDKDYYKLDASEKKIADKILLQLSERGDEVGKPLSGLSLFREKRLRDKRLYFLVYKNVQVILAIALGDKKAQQATINRILVDLANYQEYVFDTLRKKGLT